MESFRINTVVNDKGEEVLVIPDDCTYESIFHLVKDGTEYCKLLYTDKSWKVLGEEELEPVELEELTKKIEDHYF